MVAASRSSGSKQLRPPPSPVQHGQSHLLHLSILFWAKGGIQPSCLDCPALWWERHTINTQDPEHSNPHTWIAKQILDFTMFQRINEAFARPLHVIDANDQHEPSLQLADNPDNPQDSDSNCSIMEVSQNRTPALSTTRMNPWSRLDETESQGNNGRLQITMT